MKLYAKTSSDLGTVHNSGDDYIAIKLQYTKKGKVETFAKLYFLVDDMGNYELINEENDEVLLTKKAV